MCLERSKGSIVFGVLVNGAAIVPERNVTLLLEVVRINFFVKKRTDGKINWSEPVTESMLAMGSLYPKMLPTFFSKHVSFEGVSVPSERLAEAGLLIGGHLLLFVRITPRVIYI